MTRIRQWLLAAAIAAVLMLPLAQVASADPGDGGIGGYATTTSPSAGRGPTTSSTSTAADPGDGGIGD